jgi:hypothetical protein
MTTTQVSADLERNFMVRIKSQIPCRSERFRPGFFPPMSCCFSISKSRDTF